jgi:hypothetical protein
LSALAAAGVGVKELQELARHSDPRLTIGIYTHTRPAALAASVARLQLPRAGEANPFDTMSREDRETALAGSFAMLAVPFTPQLTPAVAAAGDDLRRSGTDSRRTASAKGTKKPRGNRGSETS